MYGFNHNLGSYDIVTLLQNRYPFGGQMVTFLFG